MDGCSVTQVGGEEGKHGFQDGGVDWSGGVVIEINARGHNSLRITGVRRGRNCAQWQALGAPATRWVKTVPLLSIFFGLRMGVCIALHGFVLTTVRTAVGMSSCYSLRFGRRMRRRVWGIAICGNLRRGWRRKGN